MQDWREYHEVESNSIGIRMSIQCINEIKHISIEKDIPNTTSFMENRVHPLE